MRSVNQACSPEILMFGSRWYAKARKSTAMANRSSNSDDAPSPSRTLDEKEIQELFETLNLSTVADREKFFRLERLSKETNPEQDQLDDALRVRFRDSTVREPTVK
jgi:hypothetical protein